MWVGIMLWFFVIEPPRENESVGIAPKPRDNSMVLETQPLSPLNRS